MISAVFLPTVVRWSTTAFRPAVSDHLRREALAAHQAFATPLWRAVRLPDSIPPVRGLLERCPVAPLALDSTVPVLLFLEDFPAEAPAVASVPQVVASGAAAV